MSSSPSRLAIASDLLEIAALLRLTGTDRFRSGAYERAARSLQSADANLAEMSASGTLTSLQAVGPGTARAIEEILRTGRSSLLERLRRELPPGSSELSRVRSLTRPRIEALHRALGVDGLQSLREAARAIASLLERHRLGREESTARLSRALGRPGFKVWGHPLGRLLLRRPPVDCDLGVVLDSLAASGGAVEINGDPHRLDLAPELAGEVKVRGIPFVISTDAHATDDLDLLSYGVLMARRAGLTADDVLSTLEADAFARRVRPAH